MPHAAASGALNAPPHGVVLGAPLPAHLYRRAGEPSSEGRVCHSKPREGPYVILGSVYIEREGPIVRARSLIRIIDMLDFVLLSCGPNGIFLSIFESHSAFI